MRGLIGPVYKIGLCQTENSCLFLFHPRMTLCWEIDSFQTYLVLSAIVADALAIILTASGAKISS